MEKSKKEAIYRILTYFIICSFLGWIFETAEILLSTGILTNRGLLFALKPLGHYFPTLNKFPLIAKLPFVWGLPMINIYGFGGTLIYLFLGKMRNQYIKVFFIGMVSMTIFELLGSYLCTEVIHRTFWDYSDRFLNYDGRICLLSSIAWGLLSLFMVDFIAPKIEDLFEREEDKKYFFAIVNIIIVYAIICSIFKYIL